MRKQFYTLNTDEKLSALLKSMPKVEAPENFEYNLKLKMQTSEDNYDKQWVVQTLYAFRYTYIASFSAVAIIIVCGIFAVAFLNRDMTKSSGPHNATASDAGAIAPPPDSAVPSIDSNINSIPKNKFTGGGSSSRNADADTLRFYHPDKGRIIKTPTNKTIIGADSHNSNEILVAASGAI